MFERKLHPDMTPMTLIEMIDELEKAIDYDGTPETVTVPTNVTWDMGWMLNKLRECHEAGFITDDGEPRKVLGTKWHCSYCDTIYAEYVNGCPRCHFGKSGTSTSVRLVKYIGTEAAEAARGEK